MTTTPPQLPEPVQLCPLCKKGEPTVSVPVLGGLSVRICEDCRDTAQVGVTAGLAVREFLTRVLKKD
jgi:hypothetical protein